MAKLEDRVPVALTIAGSDSSGGAGIQADLKTFTVLGVYGASVITALTAQNTTGVQGVHAVPPEFVGAQLASVFDDLNVGSVKTGMLANAEIVRVVAKVLRDRCAGPVIVDPVMVATSGDRLLTADAEAAIRDALFPVAALTTPNLLEAAALLGCSKAKTEDDMIAQGRLLLELGCGAVLMKGGHAGNVDAGADAVDVLVDHDGVTRFVRPWVDTRNTHGTGCTLSAAIAAKCVGGWSLEGAVAAGKTFLWEALVAGRTLNIGGGHGPVDHLSGVRARD